MRAASLISYFFRWPYSPCPIKMRNTRKSVKTCSQKQKCENHSYELNEMRIFFLGLLWWRHQGSYGKVCFLMSCIKHKNAKYSKAFRYADFGLSVSHKKQCILRVYQNLLKPCNFEVLSQKLINSVMFGKICNSVSSKSVLFEAM